MLVLDAEEAEAKALYRKDTELSEDDMQLIAQSAPSLKITSIYLHNCKIGRVGAGYLADALPRCRSLTALELGGNRILTLGACAIAKILPHTQIEVLFLNDNSIRDMAALALAKALPHTQLKALFLRGNLISDWGAKALAAAIPRSKLVELSLSNNPIGLEGARALIDAVTAPALPPPSLRKLHLAWIRTRYHDEEPLLDMLGSVDCWLTNLELDCGSGQKVKRLVDKRTTRQIMLVLLRARRQLSPMARVPVELLRKMAPML